jgi:nicotinamide-nucleotide amidase
VAAVTDGPPLRTAEVVAVGSELLGSTRLDTNSLFLSARLAALGIDLRAKAVVGDDVAELSAVFRGALSRADLVVLTGGLGPTDDDLTRQAVSEVLDLPLAEDPAIVAALQRRFAGRGYPMPEVNRRQAMVPRGATVLDNPNGSAPGLLIEHGFQIVLLLPGPPPELQPMVERLCAGPLLARAGRERLFRAQLFIAGRGESLVEQTVQPIYSHWRDERPPIATTILASPWHVELHLTIRETDAERATQRLADATSALSAALGDSVYSTDGRSLEEVVGRLLLDRGLTIAAAESCTGGLLMSRLTDVPGSSAYVHAGVVAYANAAKTMFAGVPDALMAAHGAVSEPVAVALAEGIRERTGADVGVGITGIAGPGGGTPAKPVGTVAIAATVPGRTVHVRTYRFIGGRAQVKMQAVEAALDQVRRLLLASA